MSNSPNELIPPKHGGDTSDPHIPHLHIRFMILKYMRLFTPIILTIVFIIDVLVYAENDILHIAIIGVTTLSLIMGLRYATNLQYKPIMYAHFSYCKCDKKRWYNKS